MYHKSSSQNSTEYYITDYKCLKVCTLLFTALPKKSPETKRSALLILVEQPRPPVPPLPSLPPFEKVVANPIVPPRKGNMVLHRRQVTRLLPHHSQLHLFSNIQKFQRGECDKREQNKKGLPSRASWLQGMKYYLSRWKSSQFSSSITKWKSGHANVVKMEITGFQLKFRLTDQVIISYFRNTRDRDILQHCKSFVSSHLLSASYFLLEYLLVVLLPRIVCILSSLEYICAHIVSLSKRWNIIPQNNWCG